MKYEVIRGTARHKGALYRKGSIFDAEDSEVKRLIRKGIIITSKDKPNTKKTKDSEES